jgi:hypothetical protein
LRAGDRRFVGPAHTAKQFGKGGKHRPPSFPIDFEVGRGRADLKRQRFRAGNIIKHFKIRNP